MLLLSVVQELGQALFRAVIFRNMQRNIVAYLAFFVLGLAQADTTGYVKYVFSWLPYIFFIYLRYGTDAVFIGAGWRCGIVVSAGSCSRHVYICRQARRPLVEDVEVV